MQSGGSLARSRGAKERDLAATLGICDLVAIQGIDHRRETTCRTSQGLLRRKDKLVSQLAVSLDLYFQA